jgi:hypothetical protein
LMLAKERSAVLALIASSLALLAMTRMTRAHARRENDYLCRHCRT